MARLGSLPAKKLSVKTIKPTKKEINGNTQWSTNNNINYIACPQTVNKLPPGVYDLVYKNEVLTFEKVPVHTDDIIRFPDSVVDDILNEITTFWEKESYYHQYNLVFKRGLLLWGPPGGGKSCTIQLIIKDIIERKGVCINFNGVSQFKTGMRNLRQIEPETPVVVLMEDIDSIIEYEGETEVLNILDGVCQFNKVLFLATTNYPEKLGKRIINRPSRFDKRINITFPNADSRRLYFANLINKYDQKIDVDKWVEDTKDLTFAHLKEIFVSVVILGHDYDETLKELESMKVAVSSDDYEKIMEKAEKKLGFGAYDDYGD